MFLLQHNSILIQFGKNPGALHFLLTKLQIITVAPKIIYPPMQIWFISKNHKNDRNSSTQLIPQAVSLHSTVAKVLTPFMTCHAGLHFCNDLLQTWRRVRQQILPARNHSPSLTSNGLIFLLLHSATAFFNSLQRFLGDWDWDGHSRNFGSALVDFDRKHDSSSSKQKEAGLMQNQILIPDWL